MKRAIVTVVGKDTVGIIAGVLVGVYLHSHPNILIDNVSIKDLTRENANVFKMPQAYGGFVYY